MSNATPRPVNGVVMSANRIAASTPRRRTGWSVTSAHSAGSRVISMQRRALADPAVLGQRPAGLAHEPDRGGVHGQAAGRAQVAGAGSARPVRIGAHAANARRAAASVSATSASPCAAEMNQASNWDGGEEHPCVEHRPEEAGVGVAVRGAGLGPVARGRRTGRRRSAASPTRAIATSRPAAAAASRSPASSAAPGRARGPRRARASAGRASRRRPPSPAGARTACPAW